MKTIQDFNTIIFDCDGVLMNSNPLKTKAFKGVTAHFGQKAQEALINYHLSNGGVSRYKKFQWLFDNILRRAPEPGELDKLIEKFSGIVKSEMLTCESTTALNYMRELTPDSLWAVVSGSDQDELRQTFETRKIKNYFNLGIYGSPRDKQEIFQDLFSKNKIETPAIYVGDSRLDHMVAEEFSCDFLFLYGWSEFSNWNSYTKEHSIVTLKDLESWCKGT